jgi:hypothetical protein
MKWKTAEMCGYGCQCSFGGVGSSIAQKINEEVVCKVPDFKKHNVTFDEERRLP